MDGQTCDMCGKMLLEDEDTRYIVRIEVFAAYDPMELSQQDLQEDPAEEMARLVHMMESMDEEELENQVYKSMRFDLCPMCQQMYLSAPLGGRPMRREGGEDASAG